MKYGINEAVISTPDIRQKICFLKCRWLENLERKRVANKNKSEVDEIK